jgi:hypothetical protein
MRDIRSDLHERANSTEEEIRALHADCEKMIEQLQKERDAKVAKAKAKLEMISKLIEFENEDMSKMPPLTPPADLPQPPSVVPLRNASVTSTPLSQMIGFKKVS